MTKKQQITIDGQAVDFELGQTVMDAAIAAGVYIPHLCHNPNFKPQGSCRLCTVNVNGRSAASCVTPCEADAKVENQTPEIKAKRKYIIELLFIEGNHFCPSCERSGNCQLQAQAYQLEMIGTDLPYQFPSRQLDASHSEVILDRDRCILCELCVRASRDVDGKNIFAISGRGNQTHLVINSESGLLKDTKVSKDDSALKVCPVGALLVKNKGFDTPIGERLYDNQPISESGHHHPYEVTAKSTTKEEE
ncbi:MAG: 2Fe-2S iron-sulfur cluster-binding protein [Colwellia sp.]|nr:2Fe-2S iron-sulfur cluster-binding protein [Colwellia sp.]